MPIPKTYTTEAIVLKKMKLGEADSILTMYTCNFGKLKAVAKGERRPKSKLGGHVESLVYSKMSLARGRNLDIVTQVQTIEGFMPLRHDLWRISYALYIAELTNKFTAEEIESYPTFNLLHNVLSWLCTTNNAKIALRYFEMHLLTYSGYCPELHRCLNCNNELQPITNYFSPRVGGVLCPQCRDYGLGTKPISVDALKVLRFVQKTDCLQADRLKINPGLSFELEQIMEHYIEHLLGEQINSTRWLDRLRIELPVQQKERGY